MKLNSKKDEDSSEEEEQQALQNNANETHDDPIVFGNQPISIKCPFCLQKTKSEIIAKPQLISIVFGLLLFSIFPNAIMIVVVIVVLQITATKKHRCSLCEREIGSNGKFLIIFTDQVYSFSLGESGILVSKKILMTGGFFLLMLLIITIKSSIQPEVIWSNMSWKELVQECPKNTQDHLCKFQNEGKTVKNWKGFVMRVDDNRQSLRRFYEHAFSIHVKMQPSQADENHPDLLLTGSSALAYDAIEILDVLTHGDEIVFNGTFKMMRKTHYVQPDRHLYLLNLNKTGSHNDMINVFVSDEEQNELGKVEGNGLRMQSVTEQKIQE